MNSLEYQLEEILAGPSLGREHYMPTAEYIDVRGPWPVYIHGMCAVSLDGVKERTITPLVARALLAPPVAGIGAV